MPQPNPQRHQDLAGPAERATCAPYPAGSGAVAVSDQGEPSGGAHAAGGSLLRRTARPVPLLAAVCLLFAAVQLVHSVPGTTLGWDETIYVSQVTTGVPPSGFGPPRARGITYLVAPVTALTSSVLVLRCVLAVLSGIGLYLALHVWRPLLPTRVLAVAGGLFAGLWITLFYGPRAMPNLWVAFAALGAAGCFLRAMRPSPARPDRIALPGLAAWLVFAALMRPSDAAWLALPLGVWALVMLRRRGRRALVVLAVLAGAFLLGSAQWVIEAYTDYGGLAKRLHDASAIQGSMGWNFAVDDHVRSADGRAFCRPCDVPWRRPVTGVWMFLLPVLTAGGVYAAVRARRAATAALPAVAGLSLAFPYLFLLSYAAPRFLLPAYALWAIPVAQCLTAAVRAVRPRLRPAVVTVLLLAFIAHLTIQLVILGEVVGRARAQAADYTRIVGELRRQGIRPPCTLSGSFAVPLAFLSRCASRQVGGYEGTIDGAGLRALAASGTSVAVLVSGSGEPPWYVRDWKVRPLPPFGTVRDLRAYLPVRQSTATDSKGGQPPREG